MFLGYKGVFSTPLNISMYVAVEICSLENKKKHFLCHGKTKRRQPTLQISWQDLIKTQSSRVSGYFCKERFFLSVQENARPQIAYLKRFCPSMKKQKLWKYDNIPYRACVMLLVYDFIVFENLRFRPSTRRREASDIKHSHSVQRTANVRKMLSMIFFFSRTNTKVRWRRLKICHLFLYKGPKRLTNAFYGCYKVEKTFWCSGLFIFKKR